MCMVIGLTGPTGAGKSSITEVAVRLGFKVINCDKIAREESENPKMLSLLCEEFGSDIAEGGILNRKKLAERAFASHEKTERLNDITLPFICERIEKMITAERVLLDAPTLFESGLDARCDKVIGVLADRRVCFDRIVMRDALSAEQAKNRLFAAKDDEYFRSRCDFIIYNNGSENDFKSKAEVLFKKITEVI